MSEVGFVTMGKTAGGADVKPIGVGMLGYAFMGKAHSNAYKTLAYMTWPPPLMPHLVAIAGRNEEAVAEAARRYGFAEHKTDWRAVATDPRVELFDNAGPNNLHAEPTIVAAEAGKHVICEKPLGRDAAESYETWQRVQATGVKHMCAFNYRFVPAVRLACEIIKSGELGDLQHFRGSYLQEWGTTEGDIWRFDKAAAGSGALGDLGAHVIDLARYLVGEIEAVAAMTQTFIPGRDVDDAVESVVRFENGAVGTIEASRFCQGRKNAFTWEINGSKGSIRFDLERLNELQVHFNDSKPGAQRAGLPHRARVRGRPPVLGALVAAGAHDRLGALVRARAAPPADRDPRRHRRGAARRHARGRLPRGRDLRRDAALGRAGRARDRHLPLTTDVMGARRRPHERSCLPPAGGGHA